MGAWRLWVFTKIYQGWAGFGRGCKFNCSCWQVNLKTSLIDPNNWWFSETVAATLGCLFFELAINRSKAAALRAELDQYFANFGQVDAISLSNLGYLNAVINETLRMHPAVPSGFQRQAPAKGLIIGNTYIPGDTIIHVPLHTMFRGMARLKDCYSLC